MNNTKNTNSHKTFCYLILLTSAAISLYLTCSFMYEIGNGAGMPTTFIAVGITFDLFKSYAPSLVSSIISRNQLTALFVGLISVGLIAISGAASVFSLQKGIDSILSDSKTAQIAQLKVDALKTEIVGLNSLHSSQLSINHITKAAQTAELISKKTEELNAEIDQAANVKDDNLLSQFATEIIYIIAIGIELISVAMTLCLHQLNNESEKQRNDLKQTDTNMPSPLVSEGFITETQHKTKQLETPIPEITFAAATTREQVLENMRVAFQSRAIEPKHRQIWDAFRTQLKQKEIKSYLEELAKRNVLRRSENGGYELVVA